MLFPLVLSNDSSKAYAAYVRPIPITDVYKNAHHERLDFFRTLVQNSKCLNLASSLDDCKKEVEHLSSTRSSGGSYIYPGAFFDLLVSNAGIDDPENSLESYRSFKSQYVKAPYIPLPESANISEVPAGDKTSWRDLQKWLCDELKVTGSGLGKAVNSYNNAPRASAIVMGALDKKIYVENTLWALITDSLKTRTYCSYGGHTIVNNSELFKSNLTNGAIITQPLLEGDYIVSLTYNSDKDDITWGDINPIQGSVSGTDYIGGNAQFSVSNRGAIETSYGYDSSIELAKQPPPTPDVVVKLKQWTEGGVVDKAIRAAAGAVLGFVITAITWSIDMINVLLNWTQKETLRTSVQDAWIGMRNIGISFLLFILIIIAFANALQIKIEQYGINRMIPKIIIAIIMAYFSWLIVMFFFDFTNALQQGAASLVGKIDSEQWSTILKSSTNFGVANFAADIGLLLMAVAMAVGILICLCILLFSLLIRVIVLSFLLAVAPLAFICNILPFTETMYKRWWSSFFKWMFMGPAVVFILALGVILATNGQPGSGGVVIDEGNITSVEVFLSVTMLAASIYLAATLPLKWGGSIMTGWQGAGKKLGKMGKKAGIFGYNTGIEKAGKPQWTTTGLKKAWSERQGGIKSRRDIAGSTMRAGISEKGGVGRFIAGVTPQQQVGLHAAAVNERRKSLGMENMTRGDLQNIARKSGGGLDTEAALTELASQGALGAEEQTNLDRYIKGNGSLQASVYKDNLDAALRSKHVDIRDNASRALARKRYKDMTPSMVEELARHGDKEQVQRAIGGWTPESVSDKEVSKNLLQATGNLIHGDEEKSIPARGDLVDPRIAEVIDQRLGASGATTAPPTNSSGSTPGRGSGAGYYDDEGNLL